MSFKPRPRVLIVDDRGPDLFLAKRALTAAGFGHVEIVFAQHGQDAIDKILGGLKPNVILLDLMMPVMDGHEFLEARQHSQDMMEIPVVVMTTSKSPSEIKRAYAQGAAGYIRKPVGLPDLTEVMIKLGNYWFDTVLLPNMGEEW